MSYYKVLSMVILCVATSSANRKMFLVETSNIVREQGNETRYVRKKTRVKKVQLGKTLNFGFIKRPNITITQPNHKLRMGSTQALLFIPPTLYYNFKIKSSFILLFVDPIPNIYKTDHS